jgi:hypothetical protein
MLYARYRIIYSLFQLIDYYGPMALDGPRPLEGMTSGLQSPDAAYLPGTPEFGG